MGSGDNVCTVNIGGQSRELVFGTRAICFIEEATGKSFADAAGRGGLSFLVVAVAAGLSHLPAFRKRFRRGDEVDLSLVEEWFDGMPKEDAPAGDGAPDTLKSIGEKVALAMRAGMPGVKVKTPAGDGQEDARPTPQPGPSTGTG